MVRIVPLTLVPLIVFNLFAFGLIGAEPGDPWLAPLITAEMISGARFTLTSGDLLIIGAIGLLFVEIVKATRMTGALADHLMSVAVFVVYLVEFLVVPAAAHSVFITLTVIALVDVIAGFSVALTSARRDIGIGRDF